MGSGVGVQCGRPFGAVVLLAFFADLLGSDPSLDFLVSEMSGGKLLVSHWQTWGGGWSRSQGSFQVGGEGRGEGGGVPLWEGGVAAVGGGAGREGESSAVRMGRGRAGETSGSGVSDVVNRGRFTPKSRKKA